MLLTLVIRIALMNGGACPSESPTTDIGIVAHRMHIKLFVYFAIFAEW